MLIARLHLPACAAPGHKNAAKLFCLSVLSKDCGPPTKESLVRKLPGYPERQSAQSLTLESKIALAKRAQGLSLFVYHINIGSLIFFFFFRQGLSVAQGG